MNLQKVLIVFLLGTVSGYCKGQTPCQSPARLAAVYKAAKVNGLSDYSVGVSPRPRLRDFFIGLHQGPPNMRLNDFCFYSLQTEEFDFSGKNISVNIYLGVDEVEWYIATSSKAVYTLKNFNSGPSDFNRLMHDMHVNVDSPDQAEAVAQTYNIAVYGEPLLSKLVRDNLSLIGIAASDFRIHHQTPDPEKEFDSWWAAERLKDHFSKKPQTTKVPDGFAVEFYVYKSREVTLQKLFVGPKGDVTGELIFD